MTCSPASGSTFPKGVTTVNCSASDAGGNVGQSFTVTVSDSVPPVFVNGCPPALSVVAPLSCPLATSSTVSYGLPQISDNCPGATVACVPPSGSVFAVGTTSVTCTATDAVGNTTSCGFAVTVWTLCLQDEGRAGNACLVNAQTGQYQFCCNGVVIATGTGTLTVRGCTVSISHTKGDRRVQLSADVLAKKGTATVLIGTQVSCQITDQNMMNNTCQCPVAGVAKF